MLIAEKVSLNSQVLRWFLLFEDLYNGEGSLQTNKTSKKENINLKQYGNERTSKLQPISFISYLSKKRKATINQEKFIFITLHKNMMIQ